jgi:hypothetical protein
MPGFVSQVEDLEVFQRADRVSLESLPRRRPGCIGRASTSRGSSSLLWRIKCAGHLNRFVRTWRRALVGSSNHGQSSVAF